MSEKAEQESFIGSIKMWLSERSTYTLVSLFYLLGLSIIILYGVFVSLGERDIRSDSPTLMTDIVFALAFFTISISGVIQAIRREVPTTIFTSIRGKPAVILGVLQAVIWVGCGLEMLIYGLVETW